MIQEFTKSARYNYSLEWLESSKNYKEYGFYDWCLNSIKGKNRVLEIGCGAGFSTIKIIGDNHNVISIEENPYMLDNAEKNLSLANIDFTSIRRGNFIVTNHGYRIEYKNINESFDTTSNVLIEGNILADSTLQEWLLKNAPFDAVICWFMGVQGAIVANDDIRNTYRFTEYEPSKYRKCVQIFLYQFGDKILRRSGVINFIDRTLLFENNQQKISTLENLKDIFGELLTSIELCYIDQLEIKNPAKINGVPLKPVFNDNVIETNTNSRYAITTVVGLKK